MKQDPILSIAIHNGKESYAPLVQNLVKSILVCNEGTSIELILIESAGNKRIREWFSALDLERDFVNFDGSKTSIQKQVNTDVKKKLLFIDYPDDLPWYTCYQDATREALRASAGQYFVFMAEDNQFAVVGNLLEECVNLLEHLGKHKSMISLSTVPRYKLQKANNRRKSVSEFLGIEYYQSVEVKWDPTYICHKDLFQRLGPMALSDPEKHHRAIEYMTSRARIIEATRYFPAVAPNVWCEESYKKRNIEIIQHMTRINPDFLLFSPITKQAALEVYNTRYRPVGCPIDTNFFQDRS